MFREFCQHRRNIHKIYMRRLTRCAPTKTKLLLSDRQTRALTPDTHLRRPSVPFFVTRNDYRGAYKASSAGAKRRGLFERLSISVIISIRTCICAHEERMRTYGRPVTFPSGAKRAHHDRKRACKSVSYQSQLMQHQRFFHFAFRRLSLVASSSLFSDRYESSRSLEISPRS